MIEPDRDTAPAVAELRDSMRRHEHLAEGGAARLLPAVRAGVARDRRPSRLVWFGVAAAVVVAASAVPVAFALLSDGSSPQVTSPPGAGVDLPTPRVPPDGWRWESSLGLEAAVPGVWEMNDFGCNQTDAPSVVRGYGVQEDCFTPEPVTKEVAIFSLLGDNVPEAQVLADAMLDPSTPRQEIAVDGVPAVRIVAALDDGRHAGVVLVPDSGAALIVRTRSEATTQAILGSVRIVQTDHVGCPAQRPEPAPSTHDGGTFVDPAPAAIGVCYYGSVDTMSALLASHQLTGDSATQLATLVNTAAPGANPDMPADQCLPDPGPPDVVLHIRGSDGTVQRVWMSFSRCIHRGLSNGVDEVHISQRILAAVMNPLSIGYSFNGDLPE